MSTAKIPNANTALYDVALECAARRLHNSCRQKQFLNRPNVCSQCRHNIYNYVPGADAREVNLLMYQTETNICDSVADSRQGTFLTWLPIVVFTLIFAYACHSMNTRELDYSVFTNSPEQIVAAAGQTYLDAVLYQVAKDFTRTKVDMNNDGLVNCIDAATLFHVYYNRPNESKITINKNPSTGMNHLFNTILINGQWVAIEPQAYLGGKCNYTMRSIWGRKYDQKYDRDATQEYEQFADMK